MGKINRDEIASNSILKAEREFVKQLLGSLTTDGNKDNENKYPRSLAQRTAESRSRYFRAIVFFVDLLLT